MVAPGAIGGGINSTIVCAKIAVRCRRPLVLAGRCVDRQAQYCQPKERFDSFVLALVGPLAAKQRSAGSPAVTSFEQFDQPQMLKLEEKLQNILSQEKKPDEMTLTEIGEYRDILVRQGGSAQLPYYRTIFQARQSQPFSCFVLALIGFAIASDLHTRRFVLAFASGLAIGISYFVVNEAILGLGSSGLTAPIVAAWAPVVLYGLLVAALIGRLSTVH